MTTEEKIAEICEKYRLDENEKKFINEILNEWDRDDLLGKNEEKIEVVAEKISHSARRREFFYALIEICAESAMARIRRKMH